MVTVKPGVWCDPCIASLVACLNYGGIETVASCCGHGEVTGWIALADGRVLVVAPDLDTAKAAATRAETSPDASDSGGSTPPSLPLRGEPRG